jgi:hypothetical protein
MKIELGIREKVRVQSHSLEILVDVHRDNDRVSLKTSFYEFNYHQLRKKEREFCMFSFHYKRDIDLYDFGFFTDAEIVWKSY